MRTRTSRRRGGFTLIEILVVLAILGIVGTVGVVKYLSYLRDASVDTAKLRLREVDRVLKIYYAKNFRYPETLEELVSPEDVEEEGVLKPSALLDPWKNEIQYAPTGAEDPPFDLISFGPDGLEGTEDDIDLYLLEEELEFEE